MPLFEVLVDRVHVVALALAVAFLGGARLLGDEVDRLAVGRPRWGRRARGVVRERACFAAVHRQEPQLSVAAEEKLPAVRCPARAAGNFAALAEAETNRRATADVSPPEVVAGPICASARM